MIELKPCPFCGGEAHVVWNARVKIRYGDRVEDAEGACVYCENCPAEIRTASKHLIEQMWNRRTELQLKR